MRIPLLLLLVGCASTARPSAPAGDPALGEVSLPALAGWQATLAIDNGTVGVWTVKSYDVFPQFGCPEIVGLDDKGRCLTLVSYSGKWTPYVACHDQKWLGGIEHADLDPAAPGKELYVGGERGNLYQIRAYPQGVLDARLIAHFPGRELHTFAAAEGSLFVFTNPGGLYRVTAEGGGFRTTMLRELEGRVRDAVRLPGEPARFAVVGRAGALEILSFEEGEPRFREVFRVAMGLGRIAERRGVLYSCADDGRVFRHEEESGGAYRTETIWNGPQGPRGVAAGHFDADPAKETIAVFGYAKEVVLLTRDAEGWRPETIFVDRDKGHWLAAAELDGRNGTDEILASGYGARIVLLSRRPGFGLSARP